MANYANVTIAVSPDLLARVRERAKQGGTTVNAIVRDFFRELVDRPAEAAEIRQALEKYQVNFEGWQFKRKEWYEESYKTANRLQKWLS